MTRGRSLVLALVATLAVACEPRDTEVLASIDAEAGVLARSTSIVVRVRGSSVQPDAGWTDVFEQTYSLARTPRPILVAMTPLEGRDDRRFEVLGQALGPSGELVAEVRAIGGYVRGEVRLLELWLEDACIDVTDCTDEQTCREGACRPAAVDVGTLPPIRDPSEVPRPTVDGSAPDSGAEDAGADVDAGAEDGGAPDAGDAGCDAGCGWSPIGVAAGVSHTCARDARGGVACWGSDTDGELGDGTPGAAATRPTWVAGLGLIDAIALGSAFSCAVRGGVVFCWGRNDHGQLGNASTTGSATPGRVSGFGSAARIATGTEHACAITFSTLECWGANVYGQVGAAPPSDRTSPVTLAETELNDVAAGLSHTCVLDAGGTVRCMGSNDRGQLGYPGAVDTSSLITVDGLTDAEQLTAGAEHTCALRAGGLVTCWGSNISNRLGAATAGPYSATPVPVPLPAEAVQVAAGSAHTCARLSDGRVVCWGNDTAGQLGDGSVDHTGPMWREVTGIDDASDLACGAAHACVVRASGGVWCWGQGASGQLGDGTSTSSPTPVQVLSP